MTSALLSCQLVVAGVFAVAAVGKLRAHAAFRASLAGFALPRRFHGPVAHGVMAVEAAIPVLVLVPATAVAGLALAAAVLTAFAAVVALTLRRGRRPRCRCLGAAGKPLQPAHVTRNLVLAAVAALGAVLGATAAEPTTVEAASLAVAALVATVALAVVVTFDDVLELVAPHR